MILRDPILFDKFVVRFAEVLCSQSRYKFVVGFGSSTQPTKCLIIYYLVILLYRYTFIVGFFFVPQHLRDHTTKPTKCLIIYYLVILLYRYTFIVGFFLFRNTYAIAQPNLQNA